MQLRTGARYRCFGDGLCCTDLHAIGPLTRREVKRLAVIAPGRTMRNPAIGAVVAPSGGGCSNLTEHGCSIHADHGLFAKPSVCRRFPYRVVTTPLGRRISTEHRCPCRTLGDRPLIDPSDALESVRDERHRVTADVVAPANIRLDDRRYIPFARYAKREARLLERILAGEDPVSVLEAEPFPALRDATWIDVAHLYRGKLDGSACGDALAWFGDVVLSLHDSPLRRLRARPWSPAFDRAEQRTTVVAAPESILADWIADELWGLEWTERGSFARARLDLVTRLTVAREVARLLSREGVRADRAAAEAVLIGEMAGAAPLWRSVVASF